MQMKDISVMGRYTQGVKLIRLGENEQVISVAKVPPNEENDTEEETEDPQESDIPDDEPGTK
jgi:DNA gyrase subunit A